MIGDKSMNKKTFNFSFKTYSMAIGALSLILSGTFSASHAQATWPNKSIRVVVPFAPGSFTDTAARTVGAELSKQLGQTVIVENKGVGVDIFFGDMVRQHYRNNKFFKASRYNQY
jgi:tripartite-type tricarboxylate transporter receptor subunit TctC